MPLSAGAGGDSDGSVKRDVGEGGNGEADDGEGCEGGRKRGGEGEGGDGEACEGGRKRRGDLVGAGQEVRGGRAGRGVRGGSVVLVEERNGTWVDVLRAGAGVGEGVERSLRGGGTGEDFGSRGNDVGRRDSLGGPDNGVERIVVGGGDDLRSRGNTVGGGRREGR